MKKTLIILVLLFSSSVFAEDISDFQVEGMSVGDSLLDYFSEEDIIKNKTDYFTNKKFTSVLFRENNTFSSYKLLQVAFKTDDSIYEIHSLNGIIPYHENINECPEMMNKIIKEVSSVFKNSKNNGPNDLIHPIDKSGKSIYTMYSFQLKFNDSIDIACYDYSLESGYGDHLSVIMRTKEFNDFLDIAYD